MKRAELSGKQGPPSLRQNVENEGKSCQLEAAVKCELNVNWFLTVT